jgi:hypothetical protein
MSTGVGRDDASGLAWLGRREYGFLFSVLGESQREGLSEVESCVVERQFVDGSPEIENVALGGAIGMKAAEDLLSEFDGEGAVSIVSLCVDRAGSAELSTASLQTVSPAEMDQHLLHRQLGAEVRVVDPRTSELEPSVELSTPMQRESEPTKTRK